ncbi:MAG: hypothetical protein EZS28_044388 [Streblomastix strix]|uniref:Uncharacterized protein n=1 Tax=Streblomastix strix TaxID=222440 RepID=A0A5J4TNH1_9EUKA|nr:MAG: hypothetical protein EZS28_044388 [Streblomastix strix]
MLALLAFVKQSVLSVLSVPNHKVNQSEICHQPQCHKLESWRNLNRLQPNQKTQTMWEKRSIATNRAETLQPREISVEISLWSREEEPADDNGSSGDERKDWRIDIQREN